MTYDEITLWRKFMQGKGVMNNFDYLYRSHRFDKRDLDTYLGEVAAEDVILSAFDFTGAGNTIFGFKYWKELNEKWQAKLTEFRNTGKISVDDAEVYCPHCERVLPRSSFALTPRGQLHKHCRECEGGQWDKQKKERKKAAKEAEKQAKTRRQLEKEIAEKQAKLERLTAGQIDVSPEGMTCQTELESVSGTAETQEAQARVVLPDKLSAPKLGEYDATLHYKKQQKSITFNAALSAQLAEGQYTKCYLNTDRQHRQFLLFNRLEGSNVLGVSSRSSMLMGVNSADICRSLAARFNLQEGDNYYLQITRNLSHKSEYLTVEVLQARSREEYVRIAQRREEKNAPAEPAPKPTADQPEAQPTASESPSPVEEPDTSLLDFRDPADITDPQAFLQQVVDRQYATERDIAAFLFNRGWELHEPVVVTRHKKFSI